MSERTFVNEVMAQPFALSECERLLHRLARDYHARCDSFDALVCTAEHNSEPYPATGEQAAAINRHARATRREIAEREGVPERELQRAIVEASRETRKGASG